MKRAPTKGTGLVFVVVWGTFAFARPPVIGRPEQVPDPPPGSDTRFQLGDGRWLDGQRLGDPTGPLGAQAGRINEAIAADLALDASQVPVHLVKNTDLPLLLKTMGGALGSGWELSGFELRGHVFVKRGLVTVPDSVLVHEVLHALSERFSGEAYARGCHNLTEGVDHFFTLGLMRRRLHPIEKNRTYIGFTDVAELIAGVIGVEKLRADFFSAGFSRLAAQVDAGRRRGTLLLICAALERRDFPAAFALLGAH